MLAITVIVFNNGMVKKKITEENRVVSAKVIETPMECDNIGRRGGYYKLQYNGQVFVKKGNRLICESIYGKQEVNVLTNAQMDKLIFLNEYEESNDFLYGILLGLFGLAITYKGWKK